MSDYKPFGSLGQEAPPYTNRGVLNTSSVNASVDWLAFTCPDDDVSPELLIPGSEQLCWVELSRGGLGYSWCRAAGHVRVYGGGRPGMGTHVEISGQGCRELEASGLVSSWSDYLDYLLVSGWKVSRLDIALDDHTAVLSMDVIRSALKEGIVVSRWKSGRSMERFVIGGEVEGETIYLGSPSSDAQMRIYDKGLEQGSQGGRWIRVELQLRDDRARRMALAIAEDGDRAGDVIAGVVYGYLDFKVRGTDSNKSRWETAEWWSEFLGAVAKVRLGVSGKVRSLTEVQLWLRKQVAPSLGVLLASVDGDVSVLADLAIEGRSRWKTKHHIMLASVAC